LVEAYEENSAVFAEGRITAFPEHCSISHQYYAKIWQVTVFKGSLPHRTKTITVAISFSLALKVYPRVFHSDWIFYTCMALQLHALVFRKYWFI
jgi:hypothetical protein